MSADMRIMTLEQVWQHGQWRSSQRMAARCLGQMTQAEQEAAIDAWIDTVRAYLAAYDTLHSRGYVDTTQEGNR